MFLKTVIMLLCAAGIAFYVRFLVASGYWVRLRVGSGKDTIAELPQQKKPVTRAA